MFEDSLFSSWGAKRSGRTRWIALASVGVQGSLVAVLVLAPLVWPDRLPTKRTPPQVATVSLLRAELKKEPVKLRILTVTSQAAMRAPSAPTPTVLETRRGGMSIAPTASSEDAPLLALGNGMRSGFSLGLGPGTGTNGTGVAVAVAAAPNVKNGAPLRVSSGVSTGLLLEPIVPVYPRIAVMARVEGTVLLTATIDRRGHIVGLQVVSGPEMLRAAATEAVKQARYRPYLLNGEPTDVVTSIAVNFRMGS